MLGSRIAAGIVMLHGFDVAEHGRFEQLNSAVRFIESPPRPGRPGRRWCGRASLCLQDRHYRQYIGQIAVDAIHAMRLERRVNRACRTGCEDAEFDRDVDLPIDDLEDIGSPFGRVAPRPRRRGGAAPTPPPPPPTYRRPARPRGPPPRRAASLSARAG